MYVCAYIHTYYIHVYMFVQVFTGATVTTAIKFLLNRPFLPGSSLWVTLCQIWSSRSKPVELVQQLFDKTCLCGVCSV